MIPKPPPSAVLSPCSRRGRVLLSSAVIFAKCLSLKYNPARIWRLGTTFSVENAAMDQV
jgi:hypothetical protein